MGLEETKNSNRPEPKTGQELNEADSLRGENLGRPDQAQLHGVKYPVRDVSNKELAQKLKGILPINELHLVRHFTDVSEDYEKALLGRLILRTGENKEQKKARAISEETIEQALDTKGSKFDKKAPFSNPKELREFVIEKLVEQAKAGLLHIFETRFGAVLEAVITAEEVVGNDALVNLRSLPEEVQQKVEQDYRGQEERDRFLFNKINAKHLPEGTIPKTKDIVVEVVFFGGPPEKAYLDKVYTGTPAPPMPPQAVQEWEKYCSLEEKAGRSVSQQQREQFEKELSIYRRFWEEHALAYIK